MIYRITLTLLLFAALNSPPARASAVECEGRFVNPITDICELLSNVVYGVGQAAFLSDSSSTWTPSLNFTLFTTNVSSTNPLSRFHFFCAASSSL